MLYISKGKVIFPWNVCDRGEVHVENLHDVITNLEPQPI